MSQIEDKVVNLCPGYNASYYQGRAHMMVFACVKEHLIA